MDDHHASRLVTLGENLAALAHAGGRAAMTLGSLARAATGGGLGRPERGPCVRHHYQCCYSPPIYRCGSC